ncbi:prepilin-type N-terminal cleavage/methylation domain-containing protein [Geobacter grbiciae]|uniref:prepilin-type N-terminal cleavage/methylation domain-containing protein n=1 Tax=Geobacter grbiciae TaxID=155042 RepID=UPI001C01BADD|nr:prepilin-type N-terminal cleavage/methylation domain-containing protein [Geobacter grbiciae]MBT1076600.1 prepilin-type N-terminal cleavage/methylation domain-containing protein [Geobacter grbiciae]
MSQSSLNGRRGFTLVELLVTMFVAALVIMAATTTFIVQNKMASVQSATSDVQISGQMVMDMLERDIRMAGFGVSKATGLAASDNALANDATCSVGTDAVQIRYSTAISSGSTRGSRAYNYYVSKDPANPGLMRQDLLPGGATDPIASNVEDLQISGVYDDDGSAVNLGNVDPARPMRVTLQILLKSQARDSDSTTAPPTIGNGIARAADGYRRRTYSVTVSPRNFGL